MNTILNERIHRNHTHRVGQRHPLPLHAQAQAGILSSRQLQQIVAEIIG